MLTSVLTNRRSTFNLGRSNLQFGSSHKKFDVWARPKPFASMFQQRIENASTGGTRSSRPLIFQDQARLIIRRASILAQPLPQGIFQGNW